MKVSQIWRYPVKSMLGDPVEAATLGPSGFEGDRGWAVRDVERQGLRSGRQLPALTRCHARYTGDAPGAVRITFPDGRDVTTDDPAVNAKLSTALGREVTIWSRRPSADLDHYRHGIPESTDMMVELRSIFGREGDEPIPDLAVFPSELAEFSSPPGEYYDCYPLMIMTTSALRALQSALPASTIDVRRFRPSVVVETDGAAGHPEFEWSGRVARIGTAELEFLVPCPRCSMVTREFTPEIPQDRAVLRHIVRELDQNVGIYAKVRHPGVVRQGDSMEFVSA